MLLLLFRLIQKILISKCMLQIKRGAYMNYDENEIKRELGLGYSSTPGPEGYRYFATFGEDGRVASSRAELII